MTSDPHRAAPAPLGAAATLARLAAIGVVILAVIAGFAYVGGWLSPSRLTPIRFVDRFQQVFGVHPGFRRNHAKGLCIAGYFESTGAAAALSQAVVFGPGRTPVTGRLSLAGGEPFAADGPAAIRGMGLSFDLADGEVWRTAMVDLPVFVARTADDFYAQLGASAADPATGKPDPAKMNAYAAAHPEFVRALDVIKSQPFASGFANATFNSLNAFRLVNAAGVSAPVRWSMTAVDQFQPEPAATSAPQDKNYLFDAVVRRIESGPVQWHLIVTVGQPGDPTDDATMAWPKDRRHLDAGTLTIDHVEGEMPGNCRDVNFDPLVLPSGIAPSDDPLLSPRSAVYSRSFTRRAAEPKQPSAVMPAQIGKGP
jgi:catalase